VICLGTLRPHLRGRRLAYGLLAGDKGAPGLLRTALAVLARDTETAARLIPSISGQVAGYRALHREDRELEMYTYPAPGVEATSQGFDAEKIRQPPH